MEVIIPQAKVAEMALGKQKRREGVPYRLFKYCLREPVEEGVLLYNTLTTEMLLLTPEEAEGMLDSDELLQKWFLVPEAQDDREFTDQLRAVAASIYKPAQYTTFYKIFTTTDCNARCYYCFEQNFTKNRKTMSQETARKVVEYIREHCGGYPVAIEWYGGEPLVNDAVIDIICRGLTEAGVDFASRMVTNGYLINADIIRRARELWRQEAVQITLDGTEEVYNRTKNYIDAEGSPYRRVMGNIEALLDAIPWVSIAMNVSEENYEDMLQLAEELKARFGGRNHFGVYAFGVSNVAEFQPGQIGGGMHHPGQHVQLAMDVRKRLAQMGLSPLDSRTRLLRAVRGPVACMAEADSGSVSILPDGALGFCGVVAEGETFGSVYSDERDSAMLERWREHMPLDGPECADCLYYPQCVRLKQCPEGMCINGESEFFEMVQRQSMRGEYRLYRAQNR